MKKGLILALAVLMVVCLAAGATLAYLFVETNQVVNTFAYGDINIDLTETVDGTSQSAATNKVVNNNFKMIPGNILTKDPEVVVKAGSEACWLFVKVEKSANFDTFMEFAMDTGWIELSTGIYYREVPAVTADTPYSVIKNNEVLVKASVTKVMLNALEETTMPTLTFTAYAVQKDNVTSVAEAWSLVETKGVPSNP